MHASKLIFLAFLFPCLWSCKSFEAMTPAGSAGRIKPSTTATYDVLPATEGSSEGGYLFVIFAIGMENKVGFLHGGSMPGGLLFDPIAHAALYNAIEAQPEADAILAPRWKVESTSYFFYSHHRITVKGKGVRYNPSVNPSPRPTARPKAEKS